MVGSLTIVPVSLVVVVGCYFLVLGSLVVVVGSFTLVPGCLATANKNLGLNSLVVVWLEVLH